LIREVPLVSKSPVASIVFSLRSVRGRVWILNEE